MTISSVVNSGDSISANPSSFFYQALNLTAVPNGSINIDEWVLIQAGSTFYSTAANAPLIARNMAIPSTRLNTNGYPDLVPLAPLYIDPIIPVGYSDPPFDAQRKYIFVTDIGSNDGAIDGYATPALYAAAVATCCQARKTSGYDLAAMCTLLPRNDGVMTEPNRTAYNSTLTGAGWAAANQIDCIIDLAGQAIMGNYANCSDSTYYVDGVHPTTAGYALLAPIWLAGINALVALL